jgi:hypothetical protein
LVIAAEDFGRFEGEGTGGQVVAALRATTLGDLDIEPGHTPMPVRDVGLRPGWLRLPDS